MIYRNMLFTVKSTVANIYKKNNKKSEIITQILLGEKFITQSKFGKFYRGYRAYDKYKGFIETKNLYLDKRKKTQNAPTQFPHLDVDPLHAGGRPNDDVVVLVGGRQKRVQVGAGQVGRAFAGAAEVEKRVVDVEDLTCG